jgi:hypothetical protein
MNLCWQDMRSLSCHVFIFFFFFSNHFAKISPANSTSFLFRLSFVYVPPQISNHAWELHTPHRIFRLEVCEHGDDVAHWIHHIECWLLHLIDLRRIRNHQRLQLRLSYQSLIQRHIDSFDESKAPLSLEQELYMKKLLSREQLIVETEVSESW